MIKRESENSVRLCCGKKGCPVITDLGDGTVSIEENGVTVVIKKEEAALIGDAVKVLEGTQILLG